MNVDVEELYDDLMVLVLMGIEVYVIEVEAEL